MIDGNLATKEEIEAIKKDITTKLNTGYDFILYLDIFRDCSKLVKIRLESILNLIRNYKTF